MASPTFGGMKRARTWSQTDSGEELGERKLPRRWNDEVSQERRYNLDRRVEGVRAELTREIQKRDADLAILREQLDQLKREFADYKESMAPALAKVDQMYALTLREHEELTPVIDDTDFDEIPPVDPRLTELFRGMELPLHELSLLESQEEYEAKVIKESERIARQESEDAQNRSLTKKTRTFERSMERSGFDIPDTVQTDGAVFATLEGTRHANEDRFVRFSFDGGAPVSVHAIFDGHGGRHAAEFCTAKLKETLEACWKQFVKEGKGYEIANALTVACVRLDAAQRIDMLINHPRVINPGTTACISLQVGDRLFVANVGDSRAVLCGADPRNTQQLTYDYKASDPHAQKTVNKRGGTIISDRVGYKGRGSLAITRAIGDEYLRDSNGKKAISPRPKIIELDLSKLDRREECTLLIMSDGASDVAKPAAMARQTKRLRDAGQSAPEIAKALVTGAQLAGSIDDITVGVIPL